MRSNQGVLAALAIGVAAACATAARSSEPPRLAPDASVNLTTQEGVGAVKGQWRYHDAKIVEVDFRSSGADRKPTGPPNRTWDIAPHAGLDFDDLGWEILDPTTLDARRSGGKVSFNWYRIQVTVPDRLGDFDPTGSTVVLEAVVDDYAEVWVDGKLPRELGKPNANLVAGWNAPNRLEVGRDVKPGQRIQLAIFGINGPISDPPSNYIWIRSAKLEFHGRPHAVAAGEVKAEVLKRDPAIDAIVPASLRVEKLAEGFAFTEGPIWAEGRLLFSDPNRNTIYEWNPDGALSVFRENSGYAGADIAEYRQPGSNGLAFDAQGRLTICEHGNRRVSRLEPDGSVTVLADRYEGKRLNSPNDLVYKSDGALYFTDPPFGLPKFQDDPRREQPHFGVYCVAGGKVQLVSKDLLGPNGLAFSPDEKFLYIGNWDTRKKVVMRYEVRADGGLANGRVFFDMQDAPGEEAIDGVKVDQRGNLYVSGPGGVWIISPAGEHLGTLRLPELPANFAWGDADGRTLYMTGRTGLYRVRLNVPGAGTGPAMSRR